MSKTRSYVEPSTHSNSHVFHHFLFYHPHRYQQPEIIRKAPYKPLEDRELNYKHGPSPHSRDSFEINTSAGGVILLINRTEQQADTINFETR